MLLQPNVHLSIMKSSNVAKMTDNVIANQMLLAYTVINAK